MRLIGLAVVLALSLILAPLAAEGQQAGKVYRVGVIIPTTPVAKFMSEPTHPFNSDFRREMSDRGPVEGQNFILELRSLEGRMERASEVVAELVRLNVDVIVTVANEMTRQAKRVTTTVPIVMAPGRAPVEAGLVDSLARPGGNIMGLTINSGASSTMKSICFRPMNGSSVAWALRGTLRDREGRTRGREKRSGSYLIPGTRIGALHTPDTEDRDGQRARAGSEPTKPRDQSHPDR